MADQWKWQRREKRLKSKRERMPKHGKAQAQIYADTLDKKINDLAAKRKIVKEIEEFTTVQSQQKLPKYGYGIASTENSSNFMPEMKEFNFIKAQIKHYIEPGDKPPKGVSIQRGKRGGLFYTGGTEKIGSVGITEDIDKNIIKNTVEKWKKANSLIEEDFKDEHSLESTSVWNQMLNSVAILRNIRDNVPRGKVFVVKSSRGIESALSYNKYPDGIEVLHLASAPWNLDHMSSRLPGGASKLLLKVFSEALKENCVVKVFPEKEAIPFYKKVGFTQKKANRKMIISIPAMKKFIEQMEDNSTKLTKENDFESEIYDLEANGHMINRTNNTIQKEFGTAASGGFTPTMNYSGNTKVKKIIEAVRKLHESKLKFKENKMSEIEDEAEEKEPQTKLQEKILGTVENFEEKMIHNFINEYQKMAILSKEYSNESLGWLFRLAKAINHAKSFNLAKPKENSRLDQVIFVDSIAHNLHKQKFADGSSLYKQLDDLADISKSIGELIRGDRLLLLQSMQNIKHMTGYDKIDILQKSTMLEKSKSLWKLFEKAIKIGVAKLSNKELVLLREWIYSKI